MVYILHKRPDEKIVDDRNSDRTRTALTDKLDTNLLDHTSR